MRLPSHGRETTRSHGPVAGAFALHSRTQPGMSQVARCLASTSEKSRQTPSRVMSPRFPGVVPPDPGLRRAPATRATSRSFRTQDFLRWK